MESIITVSLLVLSGIGLLFLGLFSSVSLVAIGCANSKEEMVRPFWFFLAFFVLLLVVVVCVIFSFLGVLLPPFGTDPLFISGFISLVPVGVISWLRKIAVPNISSP